MLTRCKKPKTKNGIEKNYKKYLKHEVSGRILCVGIVKIANFKISDNVSMFRMNIEQADQLLL